MFAHTFSATLQGIEGQPVEMQAISQRSLPQILVTGLPGDIVRESRERVRAALSHLGFDIPSMKILVHLYPASSRKQGSQFDLPMAVVLLAAEGALPESSIRHVGFVGELSLNGQIHGV